MVNSILQVSAAETGPFAGDMSILNKSDGSASWRSKIGASVVTSVNGPIEVRIRDEVLGEATLELKILPASGLAGTQERYIERLIRSLVKSSLLLGLHPRSLVQITTQIVSSAEPEVGRRNTSSSLDVIAATVNSIALACVDAGISMRVMLAAAVVTAPGGSTHVACFSFPSKELLMVESVGPCTRQELATAMAMAEQECDAVYLVMKNIIEEKVNKDSRWRES